jgi:hypothetical protein
MELAAREECGFQGNQDLYGLGIRLGIYMQWISAIIMPFFRKKGDDSLLQSYTMFLLALILAVLVITIRSDPTYVVEMLVLTYIIFGGGHLVLEIGENKGPLRKGNRDIVSKVLPSYIKLCLLTAAAIYWAWFWLGGIYSDTFLATPCGANAFLFAKVSLYDRHVTRFLSALSIYFSLAGAWLLACWGEKMRLVLFPTARRNWISWVADKYVPLPGEAITKRDGKAGYFASLRKPFRRIWLTRIIGRVCRPRLSRL